MTDENDTGDTPDVPQDVPRERIAKRLARAGLCSRREAERWIADGRVVVNGDKLTSPAFTVTDEDSILVDGKPIPGAAPARLWRYHKPNGLITSASDEFGRSTIYDSLPGDMPRVMPVGRLDLNSEGLLLLTNDGGLKRALELPKTGWVRTYRVRAYGRPSDDAIQALKDGVVIDGVHFGSIDMTVEKQTGSNVWVQVKLREGKNREVRRALDSVDLVVNRLIRTSFGPFRLGNLRPGQALEVPGHEMRRNLKGIIDTGRKDRGRADRRR